MPKRINYLFTTVMVILLAIWFHLLYSDSDLLDPLSFLLLICITSYLLIARAKNDVYRKNRYTAKNKFKK